MNLNDNVALQLLVLIIIAPTLINWLKDLLPDWFRTLLGIVFVLCLVKFINN